MWTPPSSPYASAGALTALGRSVFPMAELHFPVVAHHRIIVNAAEKDASVTAGLFSAFELVEPITETRTSSGGKYAVFAVSVRFQNREEMERFDEQLKRVPGLKMVL